MVEGSCENFSSHGLVWWEGLQILQTLRLINFD